MLTSYSLIVIPAYQELANLGYIFDMFDKLLSRDNSIQYRLFFIVSWSDGTIEFLEEKWKRYHNISSYIYLWPLETGIWYAYNKWFDYIRKNFDLSQIDTIITMDADASHDMFYIPSMHDKHILWYDLVVWSRYNKCWYRYEDKMSYLKSKSQFSWLWNFLFTIISKNKIFDKTSWFRLFKSTYIDTFSSRYPNNFTYNFYTNFVLSKACKYNTFEIPIVFKKRIYGNSKFRFLLAVRDYIYTVFKIIQEGLLL